MKLNKKGMSAVIEGILIVLIVIGVASIIFAFSKGMLESLTSNPPTNDCDNLKIKVSANDTSFSLNNVGNEIVYGVAVQKISGNDSVDIIKINEKVYPGDGLLKNDLDLRTIPVEGHNERAYKIKVVPMILKEPNDESSYKECNFEKYGVDYVFKN